MPKTSPKETELRVYSAQHTAFEGDIDDDLKEVSLFRSGNLEVDPRLSENAEYDLQDDAFNEGTFSLSSSVYNYRVENGRLYHAFRDGSYAMPCDETEMDRLDLMHCTYLHLLDGRLHLAPLSSPKRVLDVGTGTGIWAMDFADQNPKSVVIGIDLSPIQSNLVPPNCIFEIEDAESEWTWEPNSFDLIHSRHLLQGIRDWDQYIAQLYRFTAPGGYIQLAEYEQDVRSDDGSYHTGTAVHRLFSKLPSALSHLGYTDIGQSLGQRVRAAGFVDVQVHEYKMPWGTWVEDEKMKMVGRYTTLLLCRETFEAQCVGLLTRSGIMSGEEAQRACAEAADEVRDVSKGLHAYNVQYIVVARKPTGGNR